MDGDTFELLEYETYYMDISELQRRGSHCSGCTTDKSNFALIRFTHERGMLQVKAFACGANVLEGTRSNRIC